MLEKEITKKDSVYKWIQIEKQRVPLHQIDRESPLPRSFIFKDFVIYFFCYFFPPLTLFINQYADYPLEFYNHSVLKFIYNKFKSATKKGETKELDVEAQKRFCMLGWVVLNTVLMIYTYVVTSLTNSIDNFFLILKWGTPGIYLLRCLANSYIAACNEVVYDLQYLKNFPIVMPDEMEKEESNYLQGNNNYRTQNRHTAYDFFHYVASQINYDPKINWRRGKFLTGISFLIAIIPSLILMGLREKISTIYHLSLIAANFSITLPISVVLLRGFTQSFSLYQSMNKTMQRLMVSTYSEKFNAEKIIALNPSPMVKVPKQQPQQMSQNLSQNQPISQISQQSSQNLHPQPMTTQTTQIPQQSSQNLHPQPMTTQPIVTQPLSTQSMITNQQHISQLPQQSSQNLHPQPMTTQPIVTQPLSTQSMITNQQHISQLPQQSSQNLPPQTNVPNPPPQPTFNFPPAPSNTTRSKQPGVHKQPQRFSEKIILNLTHPDNLRAYFHTHGALTKREHSLESKLITFTASVVAIVSLYMLSILFLNLIFENHENAVKFINFAQHSTGEFAKRIVGNIIYLKNVDLVVMSYLVFVLVATMIFIAYLGSSYNYSARNAQSQYLNEVCLSATLELQCDGWNERRMSKERKMQLETVTKMVEAMSKHFENHVNDLGILGFSYSSIYWYMVAFFSANFFTIVRKQLNF